MILYNITTISKGKLQITASHKVVAFRIISGRRIVETVTPSPSLATEDKASDRGGSGKQGMAQC